MGFLKELVEDVESAAKIETWRQRRVATVLVLTAVVGFVLADSGHLGDTIGDALSTRGLSLFHDVTVELIVYEEDPYQFEGGDSEDDELRVFVAGKVTPCTGVTEVVASLYRTDLPLPKRPKEWTQEIVTGVDCRWRAPRPFSITDLGSYEVEAHVHRAGHDIGGTTERIKRIRPTGVEKSMLFVEPSTKQVTGDQKGRVTVVYLAKPNFNRRVFERLLFELNRRLHSFEVQVADFDGPSCVKKETSQAKDCFDSLRKQSFGPGLVIGIVPNTLENEDTTNLYSVTAADHRFMILSSDQSLFFNGRSSPSIYKYALTIIVAAGASIGRNAEAPVFYHRDVTRGCIFDYDREKARAQIAVETGYLCAEHRSRFRAAGMSDPELQDLTETLPLRWLK